MRTGLGLSPFGTSPYGLGTPDVAPVVGGVALNDETLVAKAARFIDPKTRQYVYDANGRPKGMGSVPQIVQIIMATVLNSSAVLGLGNSLGAIEDAGDDIEAQIRSRLADAFARPVRDKLLAILAVDIERFGNAGGKNGARIRVRFKDLTTGLEGTAETR